MGHCSASDAYTRRFDDAFQDIPIKYKCVADTLLYDMGIEKVFWHTYDYHTEAREVPVLQAGGGVLGVPPWLGCIQAHI